jgi:hypothetical protein
MLLVYPVDMFPFMILLPIGLDAGGKFSQFLRSKAKFHRYQG